MQSSTKAAIAVVLLAVAAGAWAQKPVAYPAKGQSAAQQQKDDGECYAWAKQSTGVDPAHLPSAPPPPQATPGRNMARGAAAGAAVGAIGGNDVGNAAAKGAVIGGVAGAARRRGQTQAQEQAAGQQQQQSMQTFNRAYGACMSGRGYSIQ